MKKLILTTTLLITSAFSNSLYHNLKNCKENNTPVIDNFLMTNLIVDNYLRTKHLSEDNAIPILITDSYCKNAKLDNVSAGREFYSLNMKTIQSDIINIEKAIKLIEEVENKITKNSKFFIYLADRAYYLKALKEGTFNNYEDSIKYFEKIKYQKSGEFYYNLAVAYYFKNDLDNAIKNFKESANQRFGEAAAALGMIYLQTGNEELSRKWFLRGKRMGSLKSAYYLANYIKAVEKEDERALREFENIYMVKDSFSELSALAIMEIYRKKGNHKEAEKWFERSKSLKGKTSERDKVNHFKMNDSFIDTPLHK